MNEPSITIVTGAVRSGKTTWLRNNYAGKENVYGILTPVINEKRVFLNIATGEIFPMEAAEEKKEVLAVGRYQFSKKAFQKAITILSHALEGNKGIIILDEIGPLELRGEGFYEIVNKLVANQNSGLQKIMVVRESILEDVIHLFQIKNYILIPKSG